jgi:hypothetical protein
MAEIERIRKEKDISRSAAAAYLIKMGLELESRSKIEP